MVVILSSPSAPSADPCDRRVRADTAPFTPFLAAHAPVPRESGERLACGVAVREVQQLFLLAGAGEPLAGVAAHRQRAQDLPREHRAGAVRLEPLFDVTLQRSAGAAQHLRDARILSIYEGTNGIQAIDLVTRKLAISGGETVRRQIDAMRQIAGRLANADCTSLQAAAVPIAKAVDSLERATSFMLGALAQNATEEALSGATPYLRLFATAQIAFSFVLLAGAGMLVAALLALSHANTGHDTRQVLALDVPPLALGQKAEKDVDFYQEVTERIGKMRIIATDGTIGSALDGLPDVDARGQGGLLDVALDPNFAQNPLVYWSYAERGEGGNSTAVARGRLSDNETALTDVRVIFSQQPKLPSTAHFGSRLVFDDDGNALASGQIDYTIDLSTGVMTPLPRAIIRSPGRAGESGRSAQYAASPDGSRLAYADRGDNGRNQVFVANLGDRFALVKATRRDAKKHWWQSDGFETTTMETMTEPPSKLKLSPDGKSLAFVSDRTGGGDIYALTLATGALRQITFDDPTYYTRPFGFKTTLLLQPDTDVLEYVCTENQKLRAR